MGVYIKGMEMPKVTTRFIIFADGRVEDEDDSAYKYSAVPVPPHGRLIDGDIAEAICFTEEDENGKDFCDGILYAADWISEQPTIIPAEEGK